MFETDLEKNRAEKTKELEKRKKEKTKKPSAKLYSQS